MQDLRLVAANENGTHLVLRSPAGDKYLLSIDERLRAAVRGDRARLGQLEIEHDGQLRPRDIQARIRAGATAEQVAASAGVPVERVRRFEGPVLAEREHMAQMAQRGAVRRPDQPEGRPATLAEALAARLDPLRIKPEDLGWDSWRRDDGRWLVQLAVELTEDDTCHARFLYDPRARTVCAENDEGRWLAGELEQRPARAPFVPRLAERPADDATEAPTGVPASIRGEHPAGRRLPDAPTRRNAPESARPAPAAVADRPAPDVVAARSVPDVVATRPAPDVIARHAPAAPSSAAPPAPSPHSAPAARGTGPRPTAPEAPAARTSVPAVDTRPRRVPALDFLVPPVPDGPVEQPTPPRREPANRGPARRPGIRADVLARPQRRSVMDLPPATGTAAREEEPAEERRTGTHDGRGLLTGASSGGRSRRASVPSWDDILFGTRRRD
jgi:hypothetical protein